VTQLHIPQEINFRLRLLRTVYT